MILLHYGNNKNKYIRYGIYAILIVVVAILQNTVGFPPAVFGARAFILLPVCVSIAMYEREIAAAVFGVIAGVLWDVSSASDGFNAVVLLILCAVCSLLISHFMRNNVLTSLVLCSGSVVAYSLIYVFVNITASGAGVGIKQFLTFYLPSCIYTLVLTPVFYFIVSWIFNSHKTADE